MTEKEYVPFGDEWFLEMKKWNKTHLIAFLRDTLIEKEKINLEIDRLRELVHYLETTIKNKP